MSTDYTFSIINITPTCKIQLIKKMKSLVRIGQFAVRRPDQDLWTGVSCAVNLSPIEAERGHLLLLLNIIIEKEYPKNSAFVLPNYLTQKDFAQLICTTRQTIISLFKELEKDGILQYSQKEIIIQDIKKIKKFAENVK